MGLSSQAAGAKKKVVTTPSGLTTSATSKPEILSLLTAAPEAHLTGEQLPRPQDRRDQGRVHHPAGFRRLGSVAANPSPWSAHGTGTGARNRPYGRVTSGTTCSAKSLRVLASATLAMK